MQLTILILAVLSMAALLLLLTLLLRRRGEQGGGALEGRLQQLTEGQERTGREVREELGRLREQAATEASRGRQESANGLTEFGDSLQKRMSDNATLQKDQLDLFARRLQELTSSNEQKLGGLTEASEKKLTELRLAVEEQLRRLQEDNARQLERMRQTVDEQLQGTLEKRLGESFKIVSERLEQVHKGLGEMQSLASDVGSLQRVLTNVKTRGGWGEIRLAALLEQVLAPDQYAANVQVNPASRNTVEFAIRMPGAGEEPVWLPVDSKFPDADYQRLLDAQENGERSHIEAATKDLLNAIRKSASDIGGKYIEPPYTTDFAILFLPTEGLYAEIIRQPGLVQELQQKYRMLVAGPTTFAALLNSLQMGFRTLAIQKRSSEVWEVLGKVKTEFGKFGDVLTKVQKKLDEASNHIEKVSVRTRAIQKNLKEVEELPSGEQGALEEGE
jgi:DNA recombination protein RmuC